MNFKVIKVNGIDKTKAKNFLNNYTPKKDESNLKTKEQKKITLKIFLNAP